MRTKLTKRKFFLGIIICISILVIAPPCLFGTVRFIGEKRIQERMQDRPTGRIKYQDAYYKYNENLITFLFMGIDKGKETLEPWEIDDGFGGQADALFLVVIDTKKKTLKVIGINRNTMTGINAYDEEGKHTMTYTAQITLQHAYGSGAKDSCEYQLATVSRLFYSIPIHGYAAVNIGVVPELNDAVGGVDVVVLEDMTAGDPSDPNLVKDREVHLMGESAYWYVKYRDIDVFASADMRLMRQKQYLTALIDTTKSSLKKNPFRAFGLYRKVMPHITTDISMPEALYLASILTKYQFNEDSFNMVPGETVMGEIYEEFYVDEDALLEMIIDTFYVETQ